MTTPPLQPGQYWRTRAGDIRYVAAVLPEWSGIQMPVIVLHNGGSGDIFTDQYTRQGGFLIYNRESDHDLTTHLPDCDSLDWAPPEHANPRDFPEDLVHENGNYTCRCLICGKMFTGLKRRMCCRVCAEPPSPNTAPQVYSMIVDANVKNSTVAQQNNSSYRPIQLLIRICSAQQSMLSELSAQVDALRSQINSGAPH